MDSEFAQIDADLVKLEAQAARASGAAKQRLEDEIKKLKARRMELAGSSDTVLAADSQDKVLDHETEEALFEIETDLP